MRLLLLGGSRYALPVIEEAHKLNIEVITADYLPDNYAHKFSDGYVNVSIVEKDEVLKIAKDLHIDGISSFGTDPGVISAAYVAERIGLPSPGSYKSIGILQDKGIFRDFLKSNGFNVPWFKTYNSLEDVLKDSAYIDYPVIVKPVDSAGSKGVTKVIKNSDLMVATKIALNMSFSGRIIIEEYIEKSGHPSDCDSFSINGKFVSFNFNDQYFDETGDNPYVPAGFSWPTSMKKKHIHPKSREMLTRNIINSNAKTDITPVNKGDSDNL